TTIELDHPDIYPTLAAYRAPFEELARCIPTQGALVLGTDDSECRRLAEHANGMVRTYGERADCEWRISEREMDDRFQHFRLDTPYGPREVTLSFPGRHNAHNATAALALADFLGAPLDTCLAACADFRGAGRRFQQAGDVGGVTVIDDYAHHPTEVAVTIAAAQQRFPGRRLIAVHTPHTYSRTLALVDDYRHSFAGADVVMLGPVDAARERGCPVTVTSEDVAQRVREGTGQETIVVASSDEAIERLVAMSRPGDVVLILSLVGFDKIANRLVDALRAPSKEPVPG
ncbi:MAG TPA: cyanophycin synthetase, partial [Candidatus Sulfotelmatobacter sp.]|nr:cyanophycin synthetase [Candidatus Sulfotelmatobacter sp.]